MPQQSLVHFDATKFRATDATSLVHWCHKVSFTDATICNTNNHKVSFTDTTTSRSLMPQSLVHWYHKVSLTDTTKALSLIPQSLVNWYHKVSFTGTTKSRSRIPQSLVHWYHKVSFTDATQSHSLIPESLGHWWRQNLPHWGYNTAWRHLRSDVHVINMSQSPQIPILCTDLKITLFLDQWSYVIGVWNDTSD